MMMHSTSSDQQKRMHLMAKSVSITVNQGDRDATQAAFTLSNNSNGGGTSVAGQQINKKLHHDSIDIDEHKEYLLLRHVRFNAIREIFSITSQFNSNHPCIVIFFSHTAGNGLSATYLHASHIQSMDTPLRDSLVENSN